MSDIPESFEVEIDGNLYDLNIQEDLSFSRFSFESVSEAAERHSTLYSFYATLAANAKSKRDRLEDILHIVGASAYRKVRKRLTNSDEPKGDITETRIKKLALLEPEYMEALKEYHEANRDFNILDKAEKAFIHRKSMIISVSANMREENAGEISLLEKEQKDSEEFRKELTDNHNEGVNDE